MGLCATPERGRNVRSLAAGAGLPDLDRKIFGVTPPPEILDPLSQRCSARDRPAGTAPQVPDPGRSHNLEHFARRICNRLTDLRRFTPCGLSLEGQERLTRTGPYAQGNETDGGGHGG
ncbi:hypothetical protein GCM10028864_53350 [Microlunatus parietis]